VDGAAEPQVLIGPVSNTLPIKLDLKGNPSFREVLRRVSDEVKEFLEHQELPLEWLAARMAESKDGSLDKVAVVMFVMEDKIGEALTFGGIKAVREETEGSPAGSSLTMLMRQRGEEFEGRIEYQASLFDDETIKDMAAAYGKLIEAVAQDIDCHIGNLPPFTDPGGHPPHTPPS
jgi:non-ribosomal peptide synthetase component F